MNFHGIVANVISAINPQTLGTVRVSLGSTIGADFRRTPAYSPPQAAMMQVQALTTKDLAQLDSLNIQGSTRSVYINGNLNGLVRQANKGGDLLSIRGQVWLVTAVLEAWPDWTKVAVTLQNGA